MVQYDFAPDLHSCFSLFLVLYFVLTVSPGRAELLSPRARNVV
jgi:hypothetical protein